jgi:hypothetical protein
MTPKKNKIIAAVCGYLQSRSYLTIGCTWLLIAGMCVVLANTLAAPF